MLKKMLLAAAVLASAAPALGADFTGTVNTLDGEPMKNGDKVLTLEEVVTNSLLASYPDEQNLSGEEKIKRFALANKIHEHPKDAQLTSDEVTLIKRLVAKAYNPLVVGQTWREVDPASVK